MTRYTTLAEIEAAVLNMNDAQAYADRLHDAEDQGLTDADGALTADGEAYVVSAFNAYLDGER